MKGSGEGRICALLNPRQEVRVGRRRFPDRESTRTRGVERSSILNPPIRASYVSVRSCVYKTFESPRKYTFPARAT